MHQRQHRYNTCGCTVIHFHTNIFCVCFLPNFLKFPYQMHQRANSEAISPLHAKHFNKNAHEFNFICFPMSRGWEQSQMRTNFRSKIQRRVCFVCIYVRFQAQASTVWILCYENVFVAHEQAPIHTLLFINSFHTKSAAQITSHFNSVHALHGWFCYCFVVRERIRFEHLH